MYPFSLTDERKSSMKHINRFIEEAEDFRMDVENKMFYELNRDYRDATIKSLEKLWNEACKLCFKNEEGKAVYTRTDRDRQPKRIRGRIPFSPWVIWDREECSDIKYNHGKWQRLQKKYKRNDNDSLLQMDLSMNQSQKDRGRTNKRSNRSKEDKDKSRSRLRIC